MDTYMLEHDLSRYILQHSRKNQGKDHGISDLYKLDY